MKLFLTQCLLGLISIYRVALSPLLGRNCRFYPSCSLYAQQCIRRHGPLRGVWLAMCRVMRCHPFHKGGVDYPP